MFEDFSFIISTNRQKNHTIQSIPKNAEIVVSTSIPLGKARNDGIKASTKDFIVICDDDISFTPIFLSYIDKLKSDDTIIVMDSYWPSPFGIGRFMLFHKSVYDKIGQFVEKSHGDETEWQIRAVMAGYKLIRIPRESVIHIPHKQSKPKDGDWMNLLWLISKHPDFPLFLIKKFFNKMKYSSNREEYETQTQEQ